MRRSARERRKPERIYETKTLQRTRNRNVGRVSISDSQTEAAQSESDIENEQLEKSDSDSDASVNTRSRKAKRVEKQERKRETTEKPRQSAATDSVLFDAVRNGNGAISSLIIEWAKRFEACNEDATLELIDFIVQSCSGKNTSVTLPNGCIGLEMGDLVRQIVTELAGSGEEYPLASRKKCWKSFQKRFGQFWTSFVSEAYDNEALMNSELIDRVVDWLTTLSSAEVRAVRHTATTAAYAMSTELARKASRVSEQLVTAKRQLKASTKSSKRASPKVNALKRTKDIHEKKHKQALKLLQLIFNGIIMHRYRDVMCGIRVASVTTLAKWVGILPQQFMQDNYLKYLGWLLNDKDAPVRLQVVMLLREMYEHNDASSKLELFTTRFLPRFLELCKDVDDAVVLAAIRLLIAVDKRNMVNPEADLDPVETLVFSDLRRDIRRAAAEFVCLQYDAFGVASPNKSSKMSKTQLITQAIALVELTEEHLTKHESPMSVVESLVDSFWGLDDCQVLKEWRVLANLVMQEKSAPDISSEQQSIVLRIFAACIEKLTRDTSNAKNGADSDRNGLIATLIKELPKFLALYQSDAELLTLVVKMYSSIPLGNELDHKSYKELLDRLKHAYLSHSEEDLLNAIAGAFQHFYQSEIGSTKRQVECIVPQLFEEIYQKLLDVLAEDEKLEKESPRTKAGKDKQLVQLLDHEHRVLMCLRHFCCLYKYINVRPYISSDSQSVQLTLSSDNEDLMAPTDPMSALMEVLKRFLEKRTRNVTKLQKPICNASCIRQALIIAYLDLLWLSQPIVQKLTTVDFENPADDSVDVLLSSVKDARASLEEMLISILQMHLSKKPGLTDEIMDTPELEEIELDQETAAFVRDAQLIAFRVYCDARCLYIESFADISEPYNRLKWDVPKALVLLAQAFFENEMDNQEPEVEDEIQKHSENETKLELLVSLVKASTCNPGSKRQAAAVLRYLVSEDKNSLHFVKAFCKHLKSNAPIRYLEIQMTALRQMHGSILLMREEKAALADEDEKMQVHQDILVTQQEMKDLAKKLSQSLGVGKIISSLRTPFVRFLCEGVRYSMDDSRHLDFLECLRPYLVHLDRPSMTHLASFFARALEDTQLPEDETEITPEWRIVFEFQAVISKSSRKQGEGRSSLALRKKSVSNAKKSRPRSGDLQSPSSTDHLGNIVAEKEDVEMEKQSDDLEKRKRQKVHDSVDGPSEPSNEDLQAIEDGCTSGELHSPPDTAFNADNPEASEELETNDRLSNSQANKVGSSARPIQFSKSLDDAEEFEKLHTNDPTTISSADDDAQKEVKPTEPVIISDDEIDSRRTRRRRR